jgi:molecular chaperone DnaK
MVQEAERNAASDRQRREQVDTKNQADSLAYQAEKQLADLNGQVPAAEKSRVEDLVKTLREAIDREDYDQMKSRSNDLQQALMQVGQAIYANANGANPSGATPNSGEGSPSGNNDVIDADFVESK